MLVRVLLTHWHAAKPHYKDQQNLLNFSTTSVSPSHGPCKNDVVLRISKKNIHVMTAGTSGDSPNRKGSQFASAIRIFIGGNSQMFTSNYFQSTTICLQYAGLAKGITC
jgi:hypothetical protein